MIDESVQSARMYDRLGYCKLKKSAVYTLRRTNPRTLYFPSKFVGSARSRASSMTEPVFRLN